MARARRAVALRDEQLLQRDQTRVGEEDAHPGRDGRGDSPADEEDANQRAHCHADDEQARRPDQESRQEKGKADVMRVANSLATAGVISAIARVPNRANTL